MRHIISASDLAPEELAQVYETARAFKHDRNAMRMLLGRRIINFFYEPSTRTLGSFELAIDQLGGRYSSTVDAQNFSSVAKGETLEDSIRVQAIYGDLIVLRHPEAGAAARAAAVMDRLHEKTGRGVPIINAGDGNNEHPTQAYLDLFTITENAPKKPLHILFFGDNRDSRTVRSLALLLATHASAVGVRIARVSFVGPGYLGVCRPDAREHLAAAGIDVRNYGERLPDAESVDVVYVTRSQRERRGTKDKGEVLVYPLAHALRLSETAIIMHPLPRNQELPDEIDDLLQAKYFEEQVGNGVFIRMAVLKFLLMPVPGD